MIQYLQVGKIVNTHGVKGEVKVIPLTDNPQRFDELKKVLVGNENDKKTLNIESVKYLKNAVIVKFKESSKMEEAEKLKELYIYVDRDNAVKLPEDTFFICDLIGIEVFETDGSCLGVIEDIIATGSNDVYIVKSDDKEILIPALKSVVKEVSITDKKMVVTLPEGLLD